MNDYTDEDLKNIIESLTPEQLHSMYSLVRSKIIPFPKRNLNRYIERRIFSKKLLEDLISYNSILANKFSVTTGIDTFRKYVQNNFNINSDDFIIQMFNCIVFNYYMLEKFLGENFIKDKPDIFEEIGKYSQKYQEGFIYFIPEDSKINLSEDQLANGISLTMVYYKPAPSVMTLSIFKNKIEDKIKAYLIHNDLSDFIDVSISFQQFFESDKDEKLLDNEELLYDKYEKYKKLLKSIQNNIDNNIIKFHKREKSIVIKGKDKTCLLCHKPERNPINQKTRLCFHCFIMYLYLDENGIVPKRKFTRLLKNGKICAIIDYINENRETNRKVRFKIPKEQKMISDISSSIINEEPINVNAQKERLLNNELHLNEKYELFMFIKLNKSCNSEIIRNILDNLELTHLDNINLISDICNYILSNFMTSLIPTLKSLISNKLL